MESSFNTQNTTYKMVSASTARRRLREVASNGLSGTRHSSLLVLWLPVSVTPDSPGSWWEAETPTPRGEVPASSGWSRSRDGRRLPTGGATRGGAVGSKPLEIRGIENR